MTLIIGALTRNYVVLVSDRRLTYYAPGDPRHGQLITDDRNKTIVVCNQFHVGYMGLANIGRQRTDEWVAERLAPIPKTGNPFVALTEEATKAFRHFDPSACRHAFLGVGWAAASRSSPDVLAPMLVIISNALTGQLQWLDRAQDHFTRQAWTLAPEQPFLWHSVGRDIEPQERTELTNRIRGHVERDGSAQGAAFLLADTLRKVAERDSAVGRGRLLSVLSRSAVGQPVSTSLTGTPGPMDEHNCWYIPADDDRNNPVQYAPTYVCPGIEIARGEVWTIKPPWWKD